MEEKSLNVITARAAISQLVSNVEGEEYTTEFIPVDVRVGKNMEQFYLLSLFKKDNRDLAIKEINKNIEENDTTAFLNPSENFVQLGLIEDDGIPFYNYKMIFDMNNISSTKGKIVSFIVDPKYKYIDDVMNRWFRFEEKLEVKKDDDIYQFIDVISRKRNKKDNFVKKLFKSKNN